MPKKLTKSLTVLHFLCPCTALTRHTIFFMKWLNLIPYRVLSGLSNNVDSAASVPLHANLWAWTLQSHSGLWYVKVIESMSLAFCLHILHFPDPCDNLFYSICCWFAAKDPMRSGTGIVTVKKIKDKIFNVPYNWMDLATYSQLTEQLYHRHMHCKVSLNPT